MKKLFYFVSILLLLLSACGTDKSHDAGMITTKHMFGNSMFGWNNHGVQRAMVSIGITGFADHSVDGAVASEIENEYITTILGGGVVDVAIVDGGADNVFQSTKECWGYATLEQSCKDIINIAIFEIGDMVTKMRNAGTTNIVIVAPYHGIGLISGFNLAADYSYPVYGSICYSTATTTCSIVDPRKEFKDGAYFFFAPDGIHPNAAGAHALVKLIAKKL